MKSSNPFIPKGPLGTTHAQDTRRRFRNAVFAVLATHLILLVVTLMGCNTEPYTTGTYGDSTAALAGKETRAVPPPNVSPVTPSMPSPAPAATILSPASTTDRIPASTTQMAAEARPSDNTPSSPKVYVVKSGDSLARIAKQFGTTTQNLKTANGLKSDSLSVGQSLRIPERSTTSRMPAHQSS